MLAVHALIAAAADARTTPAQAGQIASTYLSICVLLTLLDGLVDHQQDTRAGEPGYLSVFDDQQQLARTLAGAARRAASQTRELPNGAQHLVMLTGVIAYYISAPGARSDLARPLTAHVQRSLRPLISPTLLIMRAGRLARRAHGHP